MIQPHLKCAENDSALYAIMPGDPERVMRIAAYLDNGHEIAFNREFKSYRGYYKNIPVLVVSSGIGGTSTGIAVEEMVNIGVKNIIRIGSCGALQPCIKLGELLIASGAVRDDGTSNTYIDKQYPAVPDTRLLAAICDSADKSAINYHTGIIRSHDSFYIDNNADVEEYWSKRGVLGCDCESAALFVIGALRKIRTAAVLNVVVEYQDDLESGVNNYTDMDSITASGEAAAIKTVLEAIVKMNES